MKTEIIFPGIEEYMAPYGGYFHRSESRELAGCYLAGLLMNGERKEGMVWSLPWQDPVKAVVENSCHSGVKYGTFSLVGHRNGCIDTLEPLAK